MAGNLEKPDNGLIVAHSGPVAYPLGDPIGKVFTFLRWNLLMPIGTPRPARCRHLRHIPRLSTRRTRSSTLPLASLRPVSSWGTPIRRVNLPPSGPGRQSPVVQVQSRR